MNALEIKAAELVAIAEKLGIDTQVQIQGEHLIYVRFLGTPITSLLVYTETGKANVKSWEQRPSKIEPISLKNLPENLAWFARNLQTA
jgi:hypothetical protein